MDMAEVCLLWLECKAWRLQHCWLSCISISLKDLKSNHSPNFTFEYFLYWIVLFHVVFMAITLVFLSVHGPFLNNYLFSCPPSCLPNWRTARFRISGISYISHETFALNISIDQWYYNLLNAKASSFRIPLGSHQGLTSSAYIKNQ